MRVDQSESIKTTNPHTLDSDTTHAQVLVEPEAHSLTLIQRGRTQTLTHATTVRFEIPLFRNLARYLNFLQHAHIAGKQSAVIAPTDLSDHEWIGGLSLDFVEINQQHSATRDAMFKVISQKLKSQ